MQRNGIARHGAPLLAVLLLILIAGYQPVRGASPTDLMITNIEVTQAIQTTTNSIPLVAQRSTAVRATIVSGGGTVASVTGRLHVFVNGSEITPPAGVLPINAPFTVPTTPQRSLENDTLNFELPAPTGITASNNVTFRVDVTGPTNNPSLTTTALTVINRMTPSLYFTRVNWTPSGLGLSALADVQPGVGNAFVKGIYPVNDGDPNLYRQGLFPTLTFTEDPDGDHILDATPEGNDLLSFLASCRQIIVNMGLGAANNTFLYGWIAGNPINGNGLSQVGGFNAFGNTQQTRHQRSYAHELTHNFGLNHNTRAIDQVGWDVGARLPNNPTGNNTTGRVKPTTLFDIMFAGLLTNQAWVDTITYNFLLSSNILSESGPRYDAVAQASAVRDSESAPRYDAIAQAPAVRDEAQIAQGNKPSARVLVVQGIFDREGTRLVRLIPTFRYPWLSEPTRRREGRFAVQVIDEAGVRATVPFDPRVGDDAGHEFFGFFEVMVAVPPTREVASIRITDVQGRREYGAIRRARQLPRIAVVSPRPGAQLGERTAIVWRVNTPGTPARQLMYQVAYSPNGGRSWVPVAVDIPGTTTSTTFDSTQIQRSKGDGVLRVFVSDGLNTAFADVPKLTPTAARYPAP
jgi:hypothetical protein